MFYANWRKKKWKMIGSDMERIYTKHFHYTSHKGDTINANRIRIGGFGANSSIAKRVSRWLKIANYVPLQPYLANRIEKYLHIDSLMAGKRLFALSSIIAALLATYWNVCTHLPITTRLLLCGRDNGRIWNIYVWSFRGCFLYSAVKEVTVVNGVDGLLFRCFIDVFIDGVDWILSPEVYFKIDHNILVCFIYEWFKILKKIVRNSYG